MKTCKQLSDDIFYSIEKRERQNKKKAKNIKRLTFSVALLFLLPSFLLITYNNGMLIPAQKTGTQSSESTEEEILPKNK